MYTEQKFELLELKGLSAKQIDVHLKLYAGYVKNVNALATKIDELKADSEKNALALSELTRRYAFEFNGMRLHELYFEALSGDGVMADGALKTAIENQYGSTDKFLAELTAVGLMRGIGWVLLVRDSKNDSIRIIWVSDHEVGHLAGTDVILAMDMWEHAFMVDYVPAQKGDYIKAFFANVNWGVVENRLT
ncbi:MAG: Fe-Mn family superoxide dismutase [Patescibacteria group bacterium]|jgi:Fe-Mn family superoxide dismutase